MTENSPEILMYTSPFCGYCAAAKRLLDAKGVRYTEIDIFSDPSQRSVMIERSGRRTVPQIFIGGLHIGGFDDMKALDDAGDLDTVLTSTPS
jgi:glutaredoxin 3